MSQATAVSANATPPPQLALEWPLCLPFSVTGAWLDSRCGRESKRCNGNGAVGRWGPNARKGGEMLHRTKLRLSVVLLLLVCAPPTLSRPAAAQALADPAPNLQSGQ